MVFILESRSYVASMYRAARKALRISIMVFILESRSYVASMYRAARKALRISIKIKAKISRRYREFDKNTFDLQYDQLQCSN